MSFILAIALGLTACDDIKLDPYGPPAAPVDLIVTVTDLGSEGVEADVYLGTTGELQSALVSGGQFTVNFTGALDAYQLHLIDLQIFVDDDGDLCCEPTFDTVTGYMSEVTTTADTAVHTVRLTDGSLYPSDCTFFFRCSL